MTDRALIDKKLAFIEECVSDLRRLARPDAIDHDIREQRFVEHTLQLAIQATLDVASHIVSDRRLGEPQTNYELFELLGRNGLVPPEAAPRLRAMAGFRNILVHGYARVDTTVLRTVLAEHLTDLEAFVAAIRADIA